MPQVLYNERTKRKFTVVSFDKTTGDIVLKGDLGQFKEKYDRDRFKKLGYTIRTEPDPEPVEEEG